MATITKGKTFTNGELVTPATIHQLVDAATISGIVNADISASAAIVDTKLAQISTAGKVLPAAVQGTAVITTDSRLSDSRTPVAHTHTIANVTNLQTTLDGKQASGSYAPSTGIAPSAITGTAVITTDSRLSDARTPLTHTHDDRYYTETEIDTKLSGLPVGGHTHDDRYYTETEMNTLLAGKQASGSYAPATGIAQSAVTNLTTDLAGKAPTSHTHTIANVTNLQTTLDGKQASGSYAPATGIAPSAITGTAVITTDSRLSDARTPVSHTHDDRYYTETEIDNKLSGLPVSGHTHTIANVTGLQTALDGKQASGSYAPATGIAQSAVTNLTTDLAGKAASSHTHGNITNAGAIGSTALLPVMTGTGGVLTTGFFGDLPNTFCSGTDPRLSDARQPISTHLGLVKAWVNFNHTRMLGVTNAANGESISVTAGSSSGIWNSTVAFSTGQIGIIYYITSAGAVPNASLGGINVSTLGFQIRAISGNTATIKLLAGPATTSQTITGNGGTSGFQYISYGIRAQYGVSSITKAASGSHMNFTFNFSTPFGFIDYCYNFQMDARSSVDFYIQTKGQSSIQLQVLNFSDASVSSQMNFMAFGL